MGEPACGIPWCDGAERGPDGGAVSLGCPGLSGAEEGFHLREGFLDRLEVGGVGRQVPELRPTSLDRRSRTVAVVDLEVIGDDDLARVQGGGQAMDDVALEGAVVDGLVEQQAGAEARQRERRDQRPVLPARAGGRPVRPPTPWRPTVPTRHPEVAAGLVDPDEAGRIDTARPVAPGGALCLVAFTGADGLSSRVHPSRVNARLMDA
jgi:hypothetical protein